MPTLPLILSLLGATPAPHRALDTATVSVLYREGDFDKVLETLGRTMQSLPLLTREDSAFIFKHLGVIYAAEITTREKGKYYLYQMLRAEPDADIVDMYASDAIYDLFRNVRREFEARERKAQGQGAPAKPAREASTPEKSRATWYWAGGAALAAGAGIAAYFILSRPETKTVERVVQ